MRRRVTLNADIPAALGALALTVGAALIFLPAGVIMAGVCLLAVAYLSLAADDA